MTTANNVTIPVGRLIDLEIRRRLSYESEKLYDRADSVVTNALESVPRNERLSDTQINGLLSVVNASDRVNNIRRFIQRQGDRRPAWKKNNLAGKLIQELQALRPESESIAAEVANAVRTSLLSEDQQKADQEIDDLTRTNGRWNEIHFLLAREFIQSFAVGYLYQIAGQRPEGQGEP